MISTLLAVLAILCSVGAQGDEPQQNIRRHRVTGQYVTRVHRYTYQQPGQGAGGQVTQGGGGQAPQEEPQQNVHETISQGPTSQGPSSQSVYEEISGVSSSQSVYEEISGGPASYDEQISVGVAPELRSNYDPSLENGGYSFEGDFGVNRRNRCNRGLIDRTATGIRDTVNGGVGKLMGAISGLTDGGTALGPVGGAVNAVGHAAGHLIQGKLNEVDFMINDAACGIGNIANAAADMLKTGDVVGGVGTMGKELIGGIGNMGEDFLSQAAQGIGNAANDILGFLGR